VSSKHAVRIAREGIGYRVEVDGHDIANEVLGLTLEIRPPETFITLTLVPGGLDLETAARIGVDTATAEVLQALGWTPPEPPAEGQTLWRPPRSP